MPEFKYDGQIYIRPVSRGVSLVDLDGQELDEAIEQAVGPEYSVSSGWQGRARITVEIDSDAREPTE
jgi:hypothetical protein